MLLQKLCKFGLLLKTEDSKWSASSRVYEILLMKFQIYNRGGGRWKHTLRKVSIPKYLTYPISITKRFFLHAFWLLLVLLPTSLFMCSNKYWQFKCYNSVVTISESTHQIFFYFPSCSSRRKLCIFKNWKIYLLRLLLWLLAVTQKENKTIHWHSKQLGAWVKHLIAIVHRKLQRRDVV